MQHETNTRVSIILPCYNAGKYLQRCLDSIAEQTIPMKYLQVIAVNDASTDNTAEILATFEEEYPEQVVLIHCEENQKQGAARNLALSYAEGEYITYVDADDLIRKDMLEKMYEAACTHNCDIVECAYEEFSEKDDVTRLLTKVGEKESEASVHIIQTAEDRKALLYYTNYREAVWGKLYHRSFLVGHELYFPENTFYEDCFFSQVCALYANVYCKMNQPYYLYFQNPEGSTRSAESIPQLIKEAYVQKLFLKYIEDSGLADKSYQPYRQEVEYIAIQKLLVEPFLLCMRSGKDLTETPIFALCKELVQIFPDFIENQYILQDRNECVRLMTILSELDRATKKRDQNNISE